MVTVDRFSSCLLDVYGSTLCLICWLKGEKKLKSTNGVLMWLGIYIQFTLNKVLWYNNNVLCLCETKELYLKTTRHFSFKLKLSMCNVVANLYSSFSYFISDMLREKLWRNCTQETTNLEGKFFNFWNIMLPFEHSNPY